jgi:hypothetical protein
MAGLEIRERRSSPLSHLAVRIQPGFGSIQ